MPIPGPFTPAPLEGEAQTQSPFWLRLFGSWVHLEGVTPGVALSPDRPRSELVTSDGFRYAQQAPRAAREWSLAWRHATPAAISALSVAAEAPGDVWLLDTAAAVSNMLDPRACYGHSAAAGVIDCGGVPLRAISAGAVVTSVVRGSVTSRLSLWTTAVAGAVVGSFTAPGVTSTNLTAPAGTGSRRVEAVFAPAADGLLSVAVASAVVSGLQLVEGDPAPSWMAGQRTPCKVSASDAERTLNLLPSGGQGRSDYSLTLREVG